MSSRQLTFVGVPGLLLGILAWFLFAGDSGAGFGATRGGTGDGGTAAASARDDGDAAIGDDAGIAAGTAAGAGREEIADLDAAYEAALSGFRGRVVDHARRPLAGRVVRFYRVDAEILQSAGLFPGDDGELPMRVEVHEGRTDDAGGFLVTGAWPHAIYILEADAEGDDRLTMPIDRSPGSGEVVDLGDIQLVQLGVIAGRVVDESGRPVPGAMVRAADVPSVLIDLSQVERFDPEGALIIREGRVPFVVEMPGFVKRYFDLIAKPIASTDSKGRFRLAAVQPAENVVVVNKKAYVPLVNKGVKVERGEEKDVGDLRVRTGEEAFVKVVDPDEKPVAAAEVLIGATSLTFDVDFASRAGTTDAKGELYLTGFPAGRVTVAARRDRSHPWVVVEPKNVAADIVVRLPGRFHFDVAVQSAAGSKIVAPRFKLLPSPDQGMPLDAGMMGFVKWLDLTGKVELREDGRYRIGDLIPGKYTLAVSSEDHAAAKLDFKIEKSGEGAVTLRPESPFLVRVVDSLDRPVHRAKVYVLTREAEHGPKLLEMPIVAGETDGKGRLRVDDGEAGTVRVSASHPAFGFAHAELRLPTADPVVLRMDAPGQLAGILREKGRVPAPGRWTLVLEPRFRSRTRGAMPDMPKLTVPDLEGHFAAAGLRPGKYRVRVVRSLSALTSPGGFIGFMMRARLLRDTAFEDVVIEAGQTTFVDLEAIRVEAPVDGPSARVSGQVLVNGRPGAGVMVTARGPRRFGVTADAAGRFDLGAVPAGSLTVSALDPEQADVMDFRMENHLWRKTLEIRAGEDVLLDIHIDTGRVAGTVRTAAGAPAAGVRVKATGVRALPGDRNPRTAIALAMTDSGGRYTYPTLAAAAYTIEVQDRLGHGAAHVEVGPGSNLLAVDVRLRAVHAAAGRVELAVFGEQRPRWCFLEFRQAGGADPQRASVRRDGSFLARTLRPGSYTATLVVPAGGEGNRGTRRIPVRETLVVADADLDDVVLTPRPQAGSGPPETKTGNNDTPDPKSSDPKSSDPKTPGSKSADPKTSDRKR